MSDNRPSWVDNNRQRETSHTAAIAPTELNAQSSQSQPLGATDALSAMLWIMDNSGYGRAVNYSHIEEIETDPERGRVRFFMPLSAIDVFTDNISGFMALIGRRKLATIQVGSVSDEVAITGITITKAKRNVEDD